MVYGRNRTINVMRYPVPITQLSRQWDGENSQLRFRGDGVNRLDSSIANQFLQPATSTDDGATPWLLKTEPVQLPFVLVSLLELSRATDYSIIRYRYTYVFYDFDYTFAIIILMLRL